MSSNNPNRVYLDTETTGLHPEEGDEILSLTIVDANGRLLFDERFKPKHKKEWPEAQAVNHISPDDVEHLTTIDAYMDQIGAEYKSIKSDSHRGLSDVKDAKAKQAVHVNDDRKNDAVALDMQEK